MKTAEQRLKTIYDGCIEAIRMVWKYPAMVAGTDTYESVCLLVVENMLTACQTKDVDLEDFLAEHNLHGASWLPGVTKENYMVAGKEFCEKFVTWIGKK